MKISVGGKCPSAYRSLALAVRLNASPPWRRSGAPHSASKGVVGQREQAHLFKHLAQLSPADLKALQLRVQETAAQRTDPFDAAPRACARAGANRPREGCARRPGNPTGSAVAKSKLASITGGIRLGDSHGPVVEVASYVVEFAGIDVLKETSETISLTLKSTSVTRCMRKSERRTD